LTERATLCHDCAYEFVHKGHDVRTLEDAHAELSNRKKKMREIISNLDLHKELEKDILAKLKERETKLREEVEYRFSKLIKSLIKKKEQDLKKMSDSFYKMKTIRLKEFIQSIEEEKHIKKIQNHHHDKLEDMVEIQETDYDILEKDIDEIPDYLNKLIKESLKDERKDLDDEINSYQAFFDEELFKSVEEAGFFKIEKVMITKPSNKATESSFISDDVVIIKAPTDLDKLIKPSYFDMPNLVRKDPNRQSQRPRRKGSEDNGLDELLMALDKDGFKIEFDPMDKSSLKTSCVSPSQVTILSIAQLKKLFTSFPSLLHISLDFSNCSQFNQTFVPDLKGWAGIKEIITFKLILQNCSDVGTPCVAEINKLLFELQDLTSLTLDFKDCKKIEDQCLKDLSSGLYDRSTFMRTLKLSFWNCDKITDQGLNYISNSIGEMLNLNDLCLQFNGVTRITDEGFMKVVMAINKLPDISSLRLGFADCNKLTDKGLISVGTKLLMGNLPALKEFELNLDNCYRISEQGFLAIARKLSMIEKLTSLELKFSGCSKLSEVCITDIGSSLLKLQHRATFFHAPTLKTLKLDFSKCEKIRDGSLNYLGAIISRLPFLTVLDLRINDCEYITDDVLKCLAINISFLVTLIELKFCLDRCTKLTDVGLSMLSDSMESLLNLKELLFSFEGCSKINAFGIENLTTAISKITSLERISINFKSCGKLNDDDKVRIPKMLDCVNKRSIII